MALAAMRLLPLTLELGGADAAIIRHDADIGRAASGIVWAGFSNAGQSCAGVQRVLVHEAVYKSFMEELRRNVEALRPGDGPSCDLGPMISLKQKNIVRKQIQECLAGGAQIAAQSRPFTASDGKAKGGLDDDSLWAPAIVLCGVKAGMPIMDEEVFGPVIGVLAVADDDEALAIANSSRYGLTASVWSRDRREAMRLAAMMNAGSIMINDHLMSHGLAEAPWGGFGDSGLGKTHGEAGFKEMLKTIVIVDELLPAAKRNPWWQPYSRKVFLGLAAFGDFLGGPGFIKRLKAVPRLVAFFLRSWGKG